MMANKKNYLNKNEIDNLFKIKQSKNINNIDIAKYFNYAHSTISIFFNKYVGSQNIFKNISDFINESDFKQIEISQQCYGKIQIDNRENDVVIVAMVEKNETNLIQIERKNLTKLIKILRKETKK